MDDDVRKHEEAPTPANKYHVAALLLLIRVTAWRYIPLTQFAFLYPEPVSRTTLTTLTLNPSRLFLHRPVFVDDYRAPGGGGAVTGEASHGCGCPFKGWCTSA